MPAWKILTVQLVIAFFIESAGLILTYNELPNYYLYNIYIVAEVIPLGMIAIRFQTNRQIKNAFTLVICICIGVWFYNIWDHGSWKYIRPSEPGTPESREFLFAIPSFLVNCIFLSAAYLITLLQVCLNTKSGRLTTNPVLWLCIAHVLYFGCDIPLFSQLNYIVTQKNYSLGTRLYTINQVLTLTRYSLILFSLLLYWKQSRALTQTL